MAAPPNCKKPDHAEEINDRVTSSLAGAYLMSTTWRHYFKFTRILGIPDIMAVRSCTDFCTLKSSLWRQL